MSSDFGKKLLTLRKQRNMTQDQLAKRLDIAKSTVSTYEKGAAYPSMEVLCKIGAVFGVQTDYLLGLETRNWVCVDGLNEQQVELVERLVAALKETNLP